MIKRDKTDEKYVFVDYSDLLMGAVHASDDNAELANSFLKIFSENNTSKNHGSFSEMKNYVRLQANSKEVKYLIEEVKVIDYRNLITADILKDALVRSYYEFNHEMKAKLSSYFRKYVDNEINGISNEVLESEIINDKVLMDYIKKYDDFNHYLEVKIDNKIDINEKIKKRK